MFQKLFLLAMVSPIVVGAGFGAFLGASLAKSHGLLAEIGGAVGSAILGGCVGLYAGLTVVCIVEQIAMSICRMIVGHRQNQTPKQADNVQKQKGHAK